MVAATPCSPMSAASSTLCASDPHTCRSAIILPEEVNNAHLQQHAQAMRSLASQAQDDADLRAGPVASRIAPMAIAFALFAGSIFLFWPATHGEFVWDDVQYIVDNHALRHGITAEAIRWAFTSSYAANWHPLTWLSHMTDIEIFGISPRGHHVTNLLLHSANALLLFLVLRCLTGATWRSAAVSALFAVHPLRVESVAWVAERKDLLCAFFSICAMAAYASWVRRPSGWRRARVIFLFALALLAKPMAIALPCVFLLLDAWPLRRFDWARGRRWLPLVLEKAPLFVLAVFSSVITLWAQAQAGGLISTARLPLGGRLANAVVAYLHYLGVTVHPVQLTAFHPYPVHGIPAWKVAMACIAVAGLTGYAWQARGRRPYLAMGWIWFLVSLLPVIGIVQTGQQASADRYTYLPLIGPTIALVWFFAEESRSTARKYALPACAMLAIAALALGTRNQILTWRSEYALFAHCLQVDPENWLAHSKVGAYKASAGRTEEGIFHFQEALRLNPDHEPARINLASAYTDIGRRSAAKGRSEDAISHYHRAIGISPGFAPAHADLALAYESRGRILEATDAYRHAIALDPCNAKMRNNFGSLQLKSGLTGEAIASFMEALRLAPNLPELHCNLGISLARAGRLPEAIDQYREALRLRPDFDNAKLGLKAALMSLPGNAGASETARH